MRDKAIRTLYPLAVSINNETEVYDKYNKLIPLDEKLILVEINKIKFQKAQADKIALIDSTTATAIEAIVGDNNKQKELLATANVLIRAESANAITTTQTTQLNTLDALWIEVSNLKTSGNDREAQVAALVFADFTTLADAVAAVEAI